MADSDKIVERERGGGGYCYLSWYFSLCTNPDWETALRFPDKLS